jgi:shikimate dehydrogenase
LENPESTFKALPVQADDLGAGRTVVDLVYRQGGTLLLNTAKAKGADVVDGLEILVAQGAASLERWTGRTAPDMTMREAVRDR